MILDDKLTRRDFNRWGLSALAGIFGSHFLTGCGGESESQPRYRPIKGACYGPFREGQSPTTAYPSEPQIRSDLELLKQFTPKIRTYGTSRTLFDIPRICSELGIDCYPCAHVNDRDYPESEGEINRLIEIGHKGFPTTKGLIVGNEYMLRAEGSGRFLQAKSEIISWVNRVRNETGMPVGTTDGWHLWNYGTSTDLVEAVDFIMIHIHPFWESQHSNPNLSIDNAVAHVAQKYDTIKDAYSIYGKPVIIGETGWPSAGTPNFSAVPNIPNQTRFFDEFLDWARSSGADYFAFESFDEPWKGGTEAGFGLFDKDRDAKPAILE